MQSAHVNEADHATVWHGMKHTLRFFCFPETDGAEGLSGLDLFSSLPSAMPEFANRWQVSLLVLAAKLCDGGVV